MAMASISNDVSAEGLIVGSSVLSRSAEEFENDPSVEAMWAIKAYEHAEIYFNILCSVDPRILRLTPHDDAIYKAFREEYPNLDVKMLNEDQIKSPEGKEKFGKGEGLFHVDSSNLRNAWGEGNPKWRPFCERFKDIVEDYSFGTLLRLDTTGEYSPENSMLTSRIQFYAIELARNREGFNDSVRIKYKPNKTPKQ